MVLAQLLTSRSLAWEFNPRVWIGLSLVVIGESIRIWAVGYIGNRSRTLRDDVTGLEIRGPYALCRNPLYVANILIWAGIGGVTSWLWLVVWLVLIIPYYNVIVRFEESNLHSIGASYMSYLKAVGRWFPSQNQLSEVKVTSDQKWNLFAALRSERTTLCAIVSILCSLWFL